MKAILLTAAIVMASFQSMSAGSFTCLQTKPFVKLQSTEFAYFRVHRQANDASLNWGISNPLAVDYYFIERSYDGVYFEALADVEATVSASYRYRDNTVLPGYIYYRVTAYLKDGSSVTSEIQMLRIVSKKI